MSLSRYTFYDSYIIEELRRKYQQASAKGRIRLLRQLRHPPFEIVLLAVEDTNVEVRQWITRYGDLDHRERALINGQWVFKFPERNLSERLKNDPDAFVRACLWENLDLSGAFDFQNAPQMERLAYVRNPRVGISQKFIEKLFDHEDTELGITLEQRMELILACLINAEKMTARLRFDPHTFLVSDGGRVIQDEEHFSKLWKLASKWPKDFAIQYYVYRYLGTTEETMEEIYRTCDEPYWRLAILEHCCESEDSPYKLPNTRLIELGMKDDDYICRQYAYEKAFPISFVGILESVLQSEDKCALNGMASNKRLQADILLKVKERLDELGDYDTAFWLGGRIDDIKNEVRKKQVEEDSKNAIEKLKENIEKKLNDIEKSLEDIKRKFVSGSGILLFAFFIMAILVMLFVKK